MLAKRRLLLLEFSTAGIILAMMLIFFPPFAKAFVGDDYVQLDYVLKFVGHPFAALEIFNPYWSGWYYRPLQNLWFLLNRTLFYYGPFGYYWMGLLMHGLGIAMLVGLARKVGLRWETAVACGALFAIHKHYVDVVSWISAIAIVLAGLFSMASLATYTQYLHKRNGRYLLLTFLFFLLTLLSHEEGFFLPPLLLLWRFLNTKPTKSKKETGGRRQRLAQVVRVISRTEWGMFGVMAVLIALYLFFQITRTNLTISVQDATAGGLGQFLAPLPISQFITTTIGMFLPISGLTDGLLPYSYAAAFLAVGLLAVWFWQGNRLVRLGIAWTVLHLTFIYVALWSQKPELYAGRHIYQAWIGLVLALGAGMERLQAAQSGKKKKGRRQKDNGRFWSTAIGVVILAVLVTSASHVRDVQANWLAATNEEISARQQMHTLLPQIDETMHIFAYRFPITPNFLRSVTQVWYGRDEAYHQPFGPLERLQTYGKATPNFYMLDWDGNGRLYNLMPELQESPRTVFVWSTPSSVETIQGETAVAEADSVQVLSVAGPDTNRRLAVKLDPPEDGAWRALVYTVDVPDNGVLKTAVRRADTTEADNGRLRFRLRVVLEDVEETLLDKEIAAGEEQWHEVTIPMDEYGGTAVKLRLEVSGTGSGYWADPRFTE